VYQNRVHYEAPEIPEIDVAGQEPRIGVFVCDCGINIRGTVDCPAVVEYAKNLPNVVWSEEGVYICSADFQEIIKKRIKEHNLNRVVVASCTPRTHEPLFQSTIKEAGLNPYLFEMANIRDQCSWIHMHEPEKATEKSKDLVRMAVAKSRLLEPLGKSKLGVLHSAIVVGGGLAGMTAALDIAKQGFPVQIIEKEGELGGNMKNITSEENGKPARQRLDEIIANVRNCSLITVHLNTTVEDVSGFVGNFKVKTNKGEELETGAIVVAVGAQEYKPKEGEFLYGDEKVMTQVELEEKLLTGPLNAKSVVMIQCVGSRNDEAPYCSRVCCTKAVRNAIKMKKLSPSTEVYILHKDIRTYGFREDYYKEAGELGVRFIRFDEGDDPKVEKNPIGGLSVLVNDMILLEPLKIHADAIVLSTGIRPYHENDGLAKALKVPLSKDGYFLEAHMKLRPVDFATNGVYMAGLAHWPKFMDESIAQASGAAARAMTIISREYLETEGIIAAVNEDICNGCGICEPVCEYKAITIVKDPSNPDKLKALVNEGLCKACGTCVAACPSGAMEQKGFKNAQMYAIIDAALEGGK
jgi:heterodisulfide reductase subunit A